MLSIFISMLIAAVFLYIIMELSHLIVYQEFFIVSKFKDKNKLRQCKSCSKLFRKYQYTLYLKVKEKDDYYKHCPHCEASSFGQYKTIEKQPKWASTHPDCPKINSLQHFKIKRTIKKLERIRKIQEEQKFFEDYNNIKVDFSWLENLSKINNKKE